MSTTIDQGPEREPGGRVPVDPGTDSGRRVVNRGWYLLLLVPFVGLLWLPFYAHAKPKLFGFPFFYWYQFLWVLIGAAITGLVYVLTTTSDEGPRSSPTRTGAATIDREDRR